MKSTDTQPDANRRFGPSPLREAQVEVTRSFVIAAARRLFTERGYVGTSIAAIAREAGVAVQTIYNTVGNKAALLSAILDAAASGPNAPLSVPEFMQERTDRASDLGAVVDILAEWFVEVHTRTAPVFTMIRQAAAVDADAAEVEHTRAAQRLRHYELAAAAVRARGGLSSGMTDAEAAATIFAIGHPETYRTLVRGLGWTVAGYHQWVRKSLAGALA